MPRAGSRRRRAGPSTTILLARAAGRKRVARPVRSPTCSNPPPTLPIEVEDTFVETRVDTVQDDGLTAGPSQARPSLPAFPDGSAPGSSRVRELAARVAAVVALTVSAVYLGWRAAATIDLSVWWLSLATYLLELHAVVGLGLYAFSLWNLGAGPRARPARKTPLRVAVLIPTWSEPSEVLAPTIAAAVALRPAHETWVLDDGDRPHVARPNFLTDTIGYFDDPRVALVQTPQDFYNLESFEHSRTAARDGFSEQSLFYRAILPGKNRWQAAFWCGTSALLRTAALRQVGGVATGTVTEDIHTTIRLHVAGWRTGYHNEVLARGLAAAGARQYMLQRYRWGTGAMQVLRTDNPLTIRGLSLAQRLCYAFTLLGWFDAWRSLGYLLLPAAVLFTGAVPIQAPLATFVVTKATTKVASGRGWRSCSTLSGCRPTCRPPWACSGGARPASR